MKRSHSGLAVALLSLLLVACAASAPPSGTATAPPSPEAGEVPPGMPAPVLTEDCRTLMGIIPVSSDEPSPNAWAFALRHFLLTEHADAIAFVGIYVDKVVVYPAQSYVDEAPRMVEAGAADLAADGFDVAQWEIGESRGWGFNDLCAAFDALRGEMAVGGVEGVGPLDSGYLEVLVSDGGEVDSPAIADLQSRFADLLVVSVSEGVIEADSHRSNDTTGFNAGIAIRTYARADYFSCTAAFKIQNDYGTFLLTAAHCSSAGGQGQRNATDLCWPGLSGNVYVGFSDSRILGTSGDFAVIKGTAATTGRMWTGSACTGSGEVSVVGSTGSGVGAAIGFSGHVSGHRTGTVLNSAPLADSLGIAGPSIRPVTIPTSRSADCTALFRARQECSRRVVTVGVQCSPTIKTQPSLAPAPWWEATLRPVSRST